MTSETIPRQLQRIRKQRAISQAALAGRAGLSREAYSRIETAGADPKLSTLAALCDALSLEMLLVPRELRAELEQFIAAGGRYVERPPGLDAPRSRVG